MDGSPVVDVEDPHGAVVDAAGVLNVAHARLTVVMAALLASEGWRVGGKRSPAEYLIWKAGLSPGTARQVVQVAEHPTITEPGELRRRA